MECHLIRQIQDRCSSSTRPTSAFNWIGSLTDTIRVDIQNQFAEPLVLRWSESYDTLDGIYATDVSYIISMQTGTQDDLQYYKTDSFNSDCSIAL